MNWYKQAVNIVPFSLEDDIDIDLDEDIYDLADQADKVFEDSGVRPDSTKDLSHLAIEDGRVIGAISSGWGNEDDVSVFSFDISVLPEFRGKGLVGIKLIKEAIEYYESFSSQYDMKTMMRLWVINPRLVHVLEDRFGFDIESTNSDGSAHMVRY